MKGRCKIKESRMVKERIYKKTKRSTKKYQSRNVRKQEIVRAWSKGGRIRRGGGANKKTKEGRK